ncbi:aromatic acid exporter family protein [Bacillaceae bacterium IKA-2]|nr:aromatic acid exporter family protein [Bacillaceae bacterium IKA-2]
MFKIGYRTLKTAIGAALAIAIAQAIGLNFYASAGILTILCVEKTRRQSLRISWQRLFACTLGMFFGAAIFEVIGYNPLAVAVLLILFIPTAVFLKVQAGIVTSAVIILHIYTLREVSVAIFINEFALIIIGIGMALLMNLYMPSVEQDLKKIQNELEANYKKIFQQFACFLREGDSDWDGKELTESVDLLKKGKDVALQNIENHVLRYDDQFYHYFKMREKQFDIIERMMPLITSLDHTVVQGEKIAEYLEDLSRVVRPEVGSVDFLDRLYELKNYFKEMDLPKDRDEFEIRSSLFSFVKEMEEYLIIKRHFRIK